VVKDLTNEVGGCGTDEPHSHEGAEERPTPLAGGELSQQRGGDRVVGADGHADQESQDDQPDDVADEELGDRAQNDGGQVDGEQHLAAEHVGEPATEEGAQEDADQRRGAYQAFLG
jgi:hypothetical protein